MEKRGGPGACHGFSVPAVLLTRQLGASPKRKRLCGPPSPLTRVLSPWPTHSPNAAKLGAHPGEQKPGVSPAEDREGSVSLPTPARSVKFPPGEGVGCEVCLRARPRLQNRLPPPPRPRPRTHTHSQHTHAHSHTRMRSIDTHAPTCFRDAGGDGCWPRALPELPDGRGTRGGARAAEKLITDSADYSGSLC